MIQYTAAMIERILQYISPSEVLEREVSAMSLPSDRLKKICFAVEENMSEASIDKKLRYFADWVVEELVESGRNSDAFRHREYPAVYRQGTREGDKWELSFFDMVECFVAKVLVIRDEEVIYRYKFLEPWHGLSSKVGSDLFAACAYAHLDAKIGTKRDSFQWDVILNHDNYSLKNILDKGISDNHFHLNASVPYFDLSWLSLMNSVNQRNIFQYFESLENDSRNIRQRYAGELSQEKYSILYLKAVLIRLYLYSALTDRLILLDDYEVEPVWLLEHMIENERLYDYLEQIGCAQGIFAESEEMSIDGCLEAWLREKSGTGWRARFKKACPGFYWFFWELYPGIPVRVLEDIEILTARENVAAVCYYIERNYRALPLHKCSWLFENTEFLAYRREWKRQTHRALCRLLADPYKLVLAKNHMQGVLNGFHNSTEIQYKDYMLSEVAMDENQYDGSVFAGERWFLYMMFRNRYLPVSQELDRNEELYDLFFAYLLIKEQFRRELLYNNNKVGFQNFQAYQRRKYWFMTCFSEEELVRIAVRSSFHDSALLSQELRLKPCDTAAENVEILQKYDKAICGGWEELRADCRKKKPTDYYYYVFHFGKAKDLSKCVSPYPRHRHEAFCRTLKMQADAILQMREKNRETGRRLRGVDACSSEDGCRPEVFAVAFRVLKNHRVERHPFEEKMPQLRLSYHVGEDNQDVLDGIRAIDEAIYFLNMGSGDRLGHATMLGVDAAKWYYDRAYLISIRQQDYLDNVVWLYQGMIRLKLPNVDNLLEYLEKQYQIYFERIYRTALDREYCNMETRDFDIHNYYTAWELRGDDPKLYSTVEYQRNVRRTGIWAEYSINSRVEKAKRHMEKAVILYHAYHYSPRVREEGNRSIVAKIPLHMVKGIQMVQAKFMERIAKEGIFIETNPSSNVLIAGLDSYGNHPIVNFYNKGLTDNREELNRCSQISVSINTDDLGVFVTSLRNEYALMVKALESMRDIEGNRIYKKDMVYDWIDQVRQMGNEQSFISKDKRPREEVQ